MYHTNLRRGKRLAVELKILLGVPSEDSLGAEAAFFLSSADSTTSAPEAEELLGAQGKQSGRPGKQRAIKRF